MSSYFFLLFFRGPVGNSGLSIMLTIPAYGRDDAEIGEVAARHLEIAEQLKKCQSSIGWSGGQLPWPLSLSTSPYPPHALPLRGFVM